jgi:predicted AlkP superfamily phosphohydrolase/phosphomutase
MPLLIDRGTPLIFLCLAALGCAQETPPQEPPKPRPVVVVGIDGATWDLIDPMIERGELPHLAKLVRRGRRADLISLPPLSSPVVWTTFVTGRFPRHHNVLDHTFPYREGPKRKIQSTLRRVPALWNIASHYSRTVAMVGYFATHPPEAVDGVMISDRAAQGVPHSVFPPELETNLQGEVDRLKDPEVVRKIRRRYLPWDFDLGAIHRPQDPYHRVTKMAKGRLDFQPLFEDFVQRVSLQVADRKPDLFMVYLRMPDHASHSTWLYFDEAEFEKKPSPFDRELLENVIPEAYRSTDQFLGRLLAKVGEEVNIVLLSDHGFGPATGAWKINRKNLSALSGNHRPDGIFLAAGPDIEPGRTESISALDVAPTLLALLGLPVSKEMPGHVVEQAFRADFWREFPRQSVPSFRMRWQTIDAPETPSKQAEAATLETLEALGYLNQGTQVADTGDGTGLDFWAIEPHLRRNALIGEVLFHYLRGDLEAVEEVMLQVEEKDLKFSRHLPRLVRKNLVRWQLSFDFPLVDEETVQAFEANYPGHHFVRGQEPDKDPQETP